MTRIVSLPIGDLADAFVLLDSNRRLYAALSRDETYWHVVSPLQADRVDGDGNILRAAGQLSCVCKGATFHGTCYQVMTAEAIERADASGITRPPELGPDPRAALEAGSATFDAPAGAGEMVEAWRG